MKSLERGWIWVLAALAATGCVGTTVVFSPGYVSSGDALYQLQQATGAEPLSDWHPPVMSLLWRALIAVTGTPAAMAVLQSVVLWASLLAIAWSVWEMKRTRAGSATVLALGLAPHILTFVGVVWKDTHMAFALLATVAVAMLGMRRPPERPALRWVLFGLGLLFLVYAVLVRKNAALAAVPVFAMLVLALWPKPNRRTWLLAASGLAVALVVPVVAISAIARPTHTSQLSQVMLDDLLHVQSVADLRTAKVSPDLRAHLVRAAEDCRRKGIVSNVYWFCYGKGAEGPYTAVAHTDEIRDLWLKEVPRHLPSYVEYRVQVFSRLLFATRYPYSGRIVDNNLGLQISHPRLENTLRTYVKGAVEDLPMLFRGWLWLVVGAVLAIRPGRGQLAVPVRALGLSSVVYVLGYLPILPVGIYRYVYWPAVAGSLALLLLLLGRGARSDSSSDESGSEPRTTHDDDAPPPAVAASDEPALIG